MEKKKSSIDWLMDEIQKQREDGNTDLRTTLFYCQQAKAMHRKEIEEAYVYGVAFQIDIKNGLSPIFYYNDRFGGQDNE